MNIFLLFVLPAVVLHLLSLLFDKLFPPAKPGVRNKANAETEESDMKTERKLGCVSKTIHVDESAESERNRIAPEEILSESWGSTNNISGDHGGNQNSNGVNYEKTEIYLDNDEAFNKDMVKERLVDEEDDWEGIESSKLERLFWAAVVVYVDNGDEMHGLTSDLKLQLYGLHQVATEGPCNVPQPMALKVSARAKWNAWQQLGSMSPEAAMEKYINLLTASIPGWTQVQQQEAQDERTSCRATC